MISSLADSRQSCSQVSHKTSSPLVSGWSIVDATKNRIVRTRKRRGASVFLVLRFLFVGSMSCMCACVCVCVRARAAQAHNTNLVGCEAGRHLASHLTTLRGSQLICIECVCTVCVCVCACARARGCAV